MQYGDAKGYEGDTGGMRREGKGGDEGSCRVPVNLSARTKTSFSGLVGRS